MDTMSSTKRLLCFAASLGVLALVLAGPVSAQQESSSRTVTPPQAAADDAAKSGDPVAIDQSPSNTSPTLPAATSGPLRMGTARLLDLRGAIRIGPFYVSSVDFAQALDEFRPSGGTTMKGFRNVATFVRTFMVYQHAFRRGRLALQYEPHLSVINGHSELNYTDQELSLDLRYALSQRWGLDLADYFSYVRNRNRLGSFLDAESVTGRTFPTAFVDTRGPWLSNGFSAGFTYHLSARTQLSFGPSIGYSHEFPGLTSSRSISSFSTGARAAISHTLSARKSIEGYYFYQRSIFSTDFPSTTYHTMGAGYSQALGSTWTMSTSLGVSTASSHNGPRPWHVVGSLGLVKAFPKSQLSFHFARGYGLSGFISNRYADRVDAAFEHRWTQRLSTSVGLGYQRELGSAAGSYSGEYATGQVSYRLLANVSWFANYVYKLQAGGIAQAINGSRYFFSTGLRWEPGRAAGR